MKQRPMADLVKQIRGVSYKPTDLHDRLDSNSVILLRANNIADGELNFDDVVYVDKSKVSEAQYLQKGDILICASSGSLNLVGKAAQVNVNGEYTFGAFCKVVRPLKISADYLGAFFQSPYYRRAISALAQGVNINNIKNEHIDSLLVCCPDETMQEEVIRVIRKTVAIIRERKQQLAALDALIKARFVEMFGEPISNSKQWECRSLSNVCKAIYGGGTPSKSHPEYFEGNIPWVSPKDMKASIITNSIDHITEEAVQNSSVKIVPIGAVLMVIRSGILKHTLPVAIAATELTVNQDMKAFIPGEHINAEFLLYYFKAIEADVLSGVRGVTADNIDFKEFQRRMIITPPIELQNQFAAFVAQVDKSKAVVQKALDESQTLFDSLMQQYFG